MPAELHSHIHATAGGAYCHYLKGLSEAEGVAAEAKRSWGAADGLSHMARNYRTLETANATLREAEGFRAHTVCLDQPNWADLFGVLGIPAWTLFKPEVVSEARRSAGLPGVFHGSMPDRQALARHATAALASLAPAPSDHSLLPNGTTTTAARPHAATLIMPADFPCACAACKGAAGSAAVQR